MTTQNEYGRPKSNRGFASMDTGKQREIASKGGKAAHAQGRAHEFTPDEARVAGRKGGEAVSRDRAHMAAIGRAGGQARGRNRAMQIGPRDHRSCGAGQELGVARLRGQPCGVEGSPLTRLGGGLDRVAHLGGSWVRSSRFWTWLRPWRPGVAMREASSELPILVRPVRFERTTHGFEGHCSIQLSYGRETAARTYHAERVDTSWRPVDAAQRLRAHRGASPGAGREATRAEEPELDAPLREGLRLGPPCAREPWSRPRRCAGGVRRDAPTPARADPIVAGSDRGAGGLRAGCHRADRARPAARRARVLARALLDPAPEAAERHGPAPDRRGAHPRRRLRLRPLRGLLRPDAPAAAHRRRRPERPAHRARAGRRPVARPAGPHVHRRRRARPRPSRVPSTPSTSST